MFELVDDAISRLLITHFADAGAGKVDFSFAMPSASLGEKQSTPHVNFYLYGIQENTSLRAHSLDVSRPTSGDAGSVRRGPVIIELKYLVTAHGSEHKIEHKLLSEAFVAFLKSPILPESSMSEEMKALAAFTELVVAQPLEGKGSISDLWLAMGQPQRPAVMLTVNMTVNPFESKQVRLVREFMLGTANGLDRSGANRQVNSRSIMVAAAGLVTDSATKEPLVGAHVQSADGTAETLTDERGFFHLEGLGTGKHVLQIRNRAYGPQDVEITVPPPGRSDLVEPKIIELSPLDDAAAAKEEISGIWHEPGKLVTVEISGRLRLADGSPAAYVPVRCGGRESVTDSEGFYVIRGLPPGVHVVEAQLAGSNWAPVEENSKPASRAVRKG